MSIRLYGFKSCDMVRKAMQWLDAHDVTYEFFDYRREPLDPKVVDDWFARAGWEHVFNRNSTTFKELPPKEQQGIDARKAKRMLLAQTNLIKRPLLDTGSTILLGFKADAWEKALGV